MKQRTQKIIILFFLAHTIAAQGQILQQHFQKYNPEKIGVYAGFSANSNSINNDIFNKIIFGGYIDDSAKSESQRDLNDNNRAGGDFFQQIYFRLPIDSLFHKEGGALVFGLKNTFHLDAAFSKDFFNLAFYGNTPYKGKDMDLGESEINFLNYQELQFGFIQSNKNDYFTFESGIILSLIKGQQYQSFRINKGTVHTAKDNRLDLSGDYDIFLSDSSQKGLLSMSGLGVSSNLFIDFGIGKKSKIHLQLSDLGFISYNSKTRHIYNDTSIQFSGLDINKFINGEESPFDNLNTDSIKDEFTQSKEEKRTLVALPTRIQFYFKTFLNKDLTLLLGADYRFQANYFPYVRAELAYWLGDNLGISVQFAYGGYGNIATGLGVMTNLSKKMTLYVATKNLAYLAGKYNHGASAFIGINYYIK